MTDLSSSIHTSETKITSTKVWTYSEKDHESKISRWVVIERPITLSLNGKKMITLLCTGHNLQELAAGFFYSEGFFDSPEDIEEIIVDEKAGTVNVISHKDSEIAHRFWGKRTVTSGCGKGTAFYYAIDALMAEPVETDLRVPVGSVRKLMRELNRLSETYHKTHGVHNCALADLERIIIFRDDIGRHNAVDMITGSIFLNRIPTHDKLLITTGRLTSEIVIKIAKTGIPILISRNTATSLAIELASSLNITMIGYVRAGKLTVYTGKERLFEGE